MCSFTRKTHDSIINPIGTFSLYLFLQYTMDSNSKIFAQGSKSRDNCLTGCLRAGESLFACIISYHRSEGGASE